MIRIKLKMNEVELRNLALIIVFMVMGLLWWFGILVPR